MSKSTKKLTKEIFIERSIQKHGRIFDYSKVVYINCDTKVCIIHPEHGEFWQTPFSHMSHLPRFLHLKNLANQNRKTNKKFIEEASRIHQDKYDYSKIEYVGNHDKVCIICPQHGDFYQRPSDHLSGHGCVNCGKSQRGRWTVTDWKNLAEGSDNFDSYKLYIIKCSDANETFVKVGKTFRVLDLRVGTIPYNVELFKTMEHECPYEISRLEKEMHTKFSKHQYIPQKTFGGMYECFSDKILKDLTDAI